MNHDMSCAELVQEATEDEIRKALGVEPHIRAGMKHLDPSWEQCDFVKVREWRRYVSEDVRKIWHTFTPLQKAVLARQAKDQADQEEWD